MSEGVIPDVGQRIMEGIYNQMLRNPNKQVYEPSPKSKIGDFCPRCHSRNIHLDVRKTNYGHNDATESTEIWCSDCGRNVEVTIFEDLQHTNRAIQKWLGQLPIQDRYHNIAVMAECYKQGLQCALRGDKKPPYPPGSLLRSLWIAGYERHTGEEFKT